MSQTQPGPRRPGTNEPATPKPAPLPTPDRRPDVEPDRERREPNQDLPTPEKPEAPVPTPLVQ